MRSIPVIIFVSYGDKERREMKFEHRDEVVDQAEKILEQGFVITAQPLPGDCVGWTISNAECTEIKEQLVSVNSPVVYTALEQLVTKFGGTSK